MLLLNSNDKNDIVLWNIFRVGRVIYGVVVLGFVFVMFCCVISYF